MTDYNVLVRPGAVATMSAVVLMFAVSTTAGAHQLPHIQTPNLSMSSLSGSFISSTANEVSIANSSRTEMGAFAAAVNDAYASFVEKQHRLDSRMEAVVADALWDLYSTD